MKCNQEQWDSIKDKLVGCKINSVTNFSKYNYLTNTNGSKFSVNNVCNDGKSFTYIWDLEKIEVHETWNEQIFLEACGIETERIFKGFKSKVYKQEYVNLKTLTIN